MDPAERRLHKHTLTLSIISRRVLSLLNIRLLTLPLHLQPLIPDLGLLHLVHFQQQVLIVKLIRSLPFQLFTLIIPTLFSLLHLSSFILQLGQPFRQQLALARLLRPYRVQLRTLPSKPHCLLQRFTNYLHILPHRPVNTIVMLSLIHIFLNKLHNQLAQNVPPQTHRPIILHTDLLVKLLPLTLISLDLLFQSLHEQAFLPNQCFENVNLLLQLLDLLLLLPDLLLIHLPERPFVIINVLA